MYEDKEVQKRSFCFWKKVYGCKFSILDIKRAPYYHIALGSTETLEMI